MTPDALAALDDLAAAAMAVTQYVDPDDLHLRNVLHGLADDAAGRVPTGVLSNYRYALTEER
jgi:hypothetical protein